MKMPAKSIALISGSGGTGRTTAALNLARHLARQNARVLFFDMCFGWGGLSLTNENLQGYEELLDTDENLESAVRRTDYGFDIFTCNPPEFLDPIIEDLKKIAWLANRLGGMYDHIIFDPPSGGHPLALLSAGLSERVYLFIKPEAASVASSYALLKSLRAEGIYSRVRTVFSQVETAEQAASLKTRFDLITSQFLNLKIAEGGFSYRLENPSDDFLYTELSDKSEGTIRNLRLNDGPVFQNETNFGGKDVPFPDFNQGRR